MCTCIELEFEGLCWSCVDKLHAEQEAIEHAHYVELHCTPSEDELPF